MAFTIDSTTYRSPNFNGRPANTDIWALIVHSCEGKPAGNEQLSSLPWLCNPAAGVSSHYYVTREGRIYQLVDDARRAWHAGESALNGVADCNDYSLSVELEHRAGSAPYPQLQFDALSWLCRQKIVAYQIPRSGIATHRQVALPAGRKIDPTDWHDTRFAAWADALYVPGAGVYSVRHSQAVFESPAPDGKVALDDTAVLQVGQRVEVDEVAHGGWAHLRSGLGFVPISILTRIA